ncbi:MAG: cyclic nucleotide-binding domain-containing protein [Sphingobium sp.]
MGETALYVGGIALVAALAMPDLRRVRIGAALAGLLLLGGALAKGHWELAGIAAAGMIMALSPLAVALLPRARARFVPEEERFRDRHLGGLDAGQARGLIDQGHWLSARAGETLIREGEAVAGFFYLAHGAAMATRGRQPVGQIGSGELIGEAGVLDDVPATATVILERDSRLWFVLAPALRDYVAVHDDVGQALRRSFGVALRGKLEDSNRTLAAQAS